jgi:PPOX class probable F420-dependent enzyme
MAELTDEIRTFLKGRRIASLATINADGTAQVTAVWYLFEDDTFYFGMSSNSQKWKNAIARPQATVMVDARIPAKEFGVTAIGPVELLTGAQSQPWNRKIHERYLTPEAIQDPLVGPVYAESDNVTIKLMPRKWLRWSVQEFDEEAFDGRLNRNSYVYPLDS